MGNLRSNLIFRDVTKGFIIIYLFYALASLYFIPKYNSVISKPALFSGIGLRRQKIQANHDFLRMIVNERSVIDDDQLNISKLLPVVFLIAFFGFGFFKKETKPAPYPEIKFCNLQPAYLSFCILRI